MAPTDGFLFNIAATPEELLACYEQLQGPQKLMAECLALVSLPLSQEELLKAYQATESAVGESISKANQLKLLLKLRDEGLAVVSNTGMVSMPLDVREDIAARSLAAGRSAAIAKFWKSQNIMWYRDGAYVRQREQAMHRVRLDLYSLHPDDVPALQALTREPAWILPEIVSGFSDVTSLDAFSNQASFSLALLTLDHHLTRGLDAPLARRWVKQTILQAGSQATVAGKTLYQIYDLWRGDLGSIRQLIKEGTPYVAMVAEAAADGKTSSVPVPGLPWTFQTLLYAGALMGQRRTDLLLELRNKQASLGPYFENTLIREICDAYLGQGPLIKNRLKAFQWQESWEPGWQLSVALGWCWVGLQSELAPMLPQLARAARAYSDSGFTLLAGVASEIVHRLQQQEPRPCPLLDLVKPAPDWEKKLRGLTSWAQQRKVLDSYEGAERLIWAVSRQRGKVVVEPKQQKRKKNGDWSSGRTLRLVTAAHNIPDGADAHDRRVLQAALAGYASGDAYTSEDQLAVLELVGHPRVFFEDGPNLRPVIVVRGAPKLRVTRRKGELQVRLDPPLFTSTATQVHFEPPDRVVVLSLSEAQLSLAEVLGRTAVSVPADQEDALREILSVAVSQDIVLESDLSIEHESTVDLPTDNTLRLRLRPDGLGLSGDVRVRPLGEWGPSLTPGKGGQTVTADKDGATYQAQRDLKLEKAALKNVQETLPALSELPLRIDSPWECLELLEALAERPDGLLEVEWPEGERFKITSRAKLANLGVSVSPEKDWFALSGELRVSDTQVLSLQQLLELSVQTPGRFLRLAEGEYLALTAELRAQLDRLAMISEPGGKGGRLKVNPLAAAMGISEELDIEESPLWKRREQIRQAQTLKPKLPRKLKAELRDYQKDGFTWMTRLAHWGAGACLADDMGLGKTIQTLALLLARSADGPALVIAPMSVCANWAEEVARFAPSLKVRVLSEHDRGVVLAKPGPNDLVVCTYGLMVNETERLQKIRWHTLVLDEAQAIKNPATRRFKAAVALEADFRLATTGTPIENHLEELWALFRFLNPGLLAGKTTFVSRFARPISAGSEVARETLRRLVHPFILRRTKDQVLTELPAKTEITLSVQLSPAETALYEGLRRDAEVAAAKGGDNKLFTILAHLTKLRRACCHPELVLPGGGLSSAKAEAFLDLVEELRAGDHRALVFSQFVDHLTLMRTQLESRGIPYQYLDGSTPAKKRKEAIAAFQAGEGDLFLISLKAGGVGLNLTAADYVIHLDPWWNPAVEDQASDRAHRMGQTRPVTVYRLVAADTVEQKIVALHGTKRDLADQVLSGSSKATKLDPEELLRLLRG